MEEDRGLDLSGSVQRPVAGACQCSNKLPGSIKCREFLECLLASAEGLCSMESVNTLVC